MKVYLETYGCSANKSDSEIMLGLLKENGFEITDKKEEADVLIINTCIVKTPTAKRMERRIRELSSLNRPLIVAGCMAKAERERIEKISPKASIVTPESIHKIVEAAKETIKGRKVVFDENKIEKVNLPRVSFSKIISIIQISSGCLSACSFCETRLARGILKSYSQASIVRRIEEDLKKGFKEFWITSQDNACYGFDIKTNIANLLENIVKIDGKFFVRVGMMNPYHLIKNRNILEKLVNVYKNEKIFKFVHLPLQSGSNKVLKDMNRNYTIEEFEEVVKLFRNEIPSISIETDIIVGYPTERDEDFEKTLEALKRIKFDFVNISKFSPRPKTPAEKLKELNPEIVKRRSKAAFELVRKIQFEINSKYVNKELEVFVDEKGKGKTFVGRTFNYKPVVIESEENLLGKIVNVEIIDAKSNYLIGKIKT
jgi:MiaB-like tRNA modifying enzyme